jgi:hypothetical protein
LIATQELTRKEEAEKKVREEARKKREIEETEERERRNEAARVEEQRLRAVESKKDAVRMNRGTSSTFSLCEETMTIYIRSFTNRNTSCVAMAGDGDVAILLQDDGTWDYTGGLPGNLHKMLHTRAKHHPKPSYVSLGSNNFYYLAFQNGKNEWAGPEGLTKEINESKSSVKCVAFGTSKGNYYTSDEEHYFVIFEKGGWAYNSLPASFVTALEENNKPYLDFVSLGPNGEWYMKTETGQSYWGGGSSEFDNAIRKIKRSRIKRVYWGYAGQYFIRYT